MEARRRRIAENEARFRLINEQLRRSLDGLPLEDEPIEFVCECGEAECATPLVLPLADYERVRADPVHFAVLPGHEKPDAEDVVERNDAFFVVAKRRPPGESVALATDLRA